MPKCHLSAQVTKSGSLWMTGIFYFPSCDWTSCSKRPVFCLEIFQHDNGHRIIWVRRDLRWSLAHPPVRSRVSCEASPGYSRLHPIWSWKPLSTEAAEVLWAACSNIPSHPEDNHFTSRPLIRKLLVIKSPLRFFLSYCPTFISP